MLEIISITLDNLDNLGVDKFNHLYWKGEKIVTETMINFPTWVGIAIGAAAIAAIINIGIKIADRFGWLPPPRNWPRAGQT